MNKIKSSSNREISIIDAVLLVGGNGDGAVVSVPRGIVKIVHMGSEYIEVRLASGRPGSLCKVFLSRDEHDGKSGSEVVEAIISRLIQCYQPGNQKFCERIIL